MRPGPAEGLTDVAKARMLAPAPATFQRSQVPSGFLPAAGEIASSPGPHKSITEAAASCDLARMDG
jgi:hypothetical protein